jgi:hypothetical protein
MTISQSSVTIATTLTIFTKPSHHITTTTTTTLTTISPPLLSIPNPSPTTTPTIMEIRSMMTPEARNVKIETRSETERRRTRLTRDQNLFLAVAVELEE